VPKYTRLVSLTALRGLTPLSLCRSKSMRNYWIKCLFKNCAFRGMSPT
jgi:hypothetical protein